LQHFTSNGSELQSEPHVITEAGDRFFVQSSRMLAIHKLRKNREIPDRRNLLRDRVTPAVGNIGDRFWIDAENNMEGFGLMPMDDQWIRAPVGGGVQLTGFDTRNMDPRLQQLAGEQR
jgi:hypothetical protein